ncbi:histone acetyltransferase 1 [Podochytrium sp. JEL0797]|nr:histone acetyltransferase 1 [Podochytrium sp. JEL0797]
MLFGLGAQKGELDAWVTGANGAIELKLVHSSDAHLNNLSPSISQTALAAAAGSPIPEAKRTFHPEFTYPLFGEEEVLFGYKNPVVRLHYAAGSLFTFLGMSYTYKIDNDPDEVAKSKRIGGVAPKADNVLSVVQEKLPEKGFTDNYSSFMEHVKRDEAGGFKPMGDKIYEYSVKGREGVVYEVYKTSFANPRFKAYNESLQVILLFFIEGASAIDDEDEDWECYLVFEKRPVISSAAVVGGSGSQFAYSLVGFSTAYAFWCFPDSKRMRISQFMVMPPYQKMGHGRDLYNAMKREFASRKEVIDFGVEDPNDDFSNMRDVCDLQSLVSEVERIQNSNPLNSMTSVGDWNRPGASGSNATADSHTTHAAIVAVVSNIKHGKYKLSKAQAERCIEMIQMKYLDRSNKAAVKEFRMMVKRRLYRRNEEALSGMEVEVMKEKLQETFLNVEEGYRETLLHA